MAGVNGADNNLPKRDTTAVTQQNGEVLVDRAKKMAETVEKAIRETFDKLGMPLPAEETEAEARANSKLTDKERLAMLERIRQQLEDIEPDEAKLSERLEEIEELIAKQKTEIEQRQIDEATRKQQENKPLVEKYKELERKRLENQQEEQIKNQEWNW